MRNNNSIETDGLNLNSNTKMKNFINNESLIKIDENLKIEKNEFEGIFLRRKRKVIPVKGRKVVRYENTVNEIILDFDLFLETIYHDENESSDFNNKFSRDKPMQKNLIEVK